MNIIEVIESKRFTFLKNKFALAADGGTISFYIVDLENQEYNIFLDRRMGSATTHHFYAYAYPDDAGSQYIGEIPDLLFRVEEICKHL